MSKRWFKFVALACTIAFLLLGCQTLLSQSSLHKATSTSPTVIKLSGWGGNPTEQRLLRQVLTNFEAQHPDIQVKLETIADQYMDVIKTRLIGDAAPDVFYLDALEAPFLMANEVLEPLNSYITPDFDLADFEPNLLHPFQWQDQIFGLPKDYSTLALFYNTRSFAEVGLTRSPRTWDELTIAARQLTLDRNQDGRVDQFGLGITPELARMAYMLRAFGGQVVDEQGYATFASESALQGMTSALQQYRVDRTAARPVDVGTNSGIEMFGQGKAAMVIEGCWAIPFFQDTFPELDYATVEVPRLNNQPGTMVYTVAYVMNRQSRHKAAAWQLIRYLTGKQGMEQWTSTGYALPSRRSVAEKLQFDRDALRSALVAGVDYAMPWQVGQYPSAVMNHFNNQLISVLLGERPLDIAMQQAQDDANQQIRAAQ